MRKVATLFEGRGPSSECLVRLQLRFTISLHSVRQYLALTETNFVLSVDTDIVLTDDVSGGWFCGGTGSCSGGLRGKMSLG